MATGRATIASIGIGSPVGGGFVVPSAWGLESQWGGVSDSGSLEGRRVRKIADSSGFSVCCYTSAGGSVTEICVRLRWDTGGGLTLNIRTANNTLQSSGVDVYAQNVQLSRMDASAGGYAAIGPLVQYSTVAAAVGDYIWVRVRWDQTGTAAEGRVRAKAWRDGTTEPGSWHVDATRTDWPVGGGAVYPGLSPYGTSRGGLDYFGWATAGDTAPLPATPTVDAAVTLSGRKSKFEASTLTEFLISVVEYARKVSFSATTSLDTFISTLILGRKAKLEASVMTEFLISVVNYAKKVSLTSVTLIESLISLVISGRKASLGASTLTEFLVSVVNFGRRAAFSVLGLKERRRAVWSACEVGVEVVYSTCEGVEEAPVSPFVFPRFIDYSTFPAGAPERHTHYGSGLSTVVDGVLVTDPIGPNEIGGVTLDNTNSPGFKWVRARLRLLGLPDVAGGHERAGGVTMLGAFNFECAYANSFLSSNSGVGIYLFASRVEDLNSGNGLDNASFPPAGHITPGAVIVVEAQYTPGVGPLDSGLVEYRAYPEGAAVPAFRARLVHYSYASIAAPAGIYDRGRPFVGDSNTEYLTLEVNGVAPSIPVVERWSSCEPEELSVSIWSED